MYSSALFSDPEGGVYGDLASGYIPGQLDDAQSRKLHHVLQKARVKPGHRLLEFGSGWGGLAIEVRRILLHWSGDMSFDIFTFAGCTVLWMRGRHADALNRAKDTGGGTYSRRRPRGTHSGSPDGLSRSSSRV